MLGSSNPNPNETENHHMTIDMTMIPEKGGTLNLPDPDDLAGTKAGTPYVDPTEVDHRSALDLLKADLAEELEEHTTIPVPTRPKYKIRCSLNISGDELDSWRKQARSKRHTDGIDGVKLVALILANKTVGIIRDDEPLHDGVSDLYTFRHREFIDLLKINPREDLTAAQAVQRFFGRDGAVDAAAKALLEASGWGEDVLAEPDPTVAV